MSSSLVDSCVSLQLVVVYFPPIPTPLPLVQASVQAGVVFIVAETHARTRNNVRMRMRSQFLFAFVRCVYARTCIYLYILDFTACEWLHQALQLLLLSKPTYRGLTTLLPLQPWDIPILEDVKEFLSICYPSLEVLLIN